MAEIAHSGKASSFADPADVAAFHKWYQIYRKEGLSDGEATRRAFAKGDNAIGCYGDSTAQGTGPACALPPEDLQERWGSVAAAKHKPVHVQANGREVICLVKDTMPHRANIKNGAILDLSPDAVTALGMHPPIMVPVVWKWA